MLILLSPVIILVGLLVKITSSGPIIYSSNRVGFNNRIFSMPKFRTMKVDTPTVATHLLTNPASHLTSIGSVLRKTSLDELPQLWSVLIGDMSLVGPRPALFSQVDLIDARSKAGVHLLLPGITGWAQINGRDTLSIDQKVALDRQYLLKRSFAFDLKVILLTVVAVFRRANVSH
jgi:O-antigen biosynthesis protein WbqP